MKVVQLKLRDMIDQHIEETKSLLEDGFYPESFLHFSKQIEDEMIAIEKLVLLMVEDAIETEKEADKRWEERPLSEAEIKSWNGMGQ